MASSSLKPQLAKLAKQGAVLGQVPPSQRFLPRAAFAVADRIDRVSGTSQLNDMLLGHRDGDAIQLAAPAEDESDQKTMKEQDAATVEDTTLSCKADGDTSKDNS